MTDDHIEVKAVRSFQIKDEEKGQIEAVVATLEVVDKDHDIIRKRAIPDGARVKISDYGHSAAFGAAPVGTGVLRIRGDRLVVQGHYLMSTQRGVEAFRTVKDIGTDYQEWSFGFNIIGSELPSDQEREKGAWRILTRLDAFEVSPVLRGAGIGTRTVAAKARMPATRAAERLAEQFAAICKRAASPVGRPLPERFRPALQWGAKWFAFYSSEIPPVKVVAPGAIRDGGWGCYDVGQKLILVAAGLSDEETEAVLFHELAHAYEDRKGWTPDERFAASMERELFDRWRGQEWNKTATAG